MYCVKYIVINVDPIIYGQYLQRKKIYRVKYRPIATIARVFSGMWNTAYFWQSIPWVLLVRRSEYSKYVGSSGSPWFPYTSVPIFGK